MSVELTIAKTTPSDICHVFGNLWERGEMELEVLGLSREQGAKIVANFIESGPSATFSFDGEPVLVTGLVDSGVAGGMTTWFQATEAFPLYALVITRELRALLEDFAVKNGLQFAEIVSPCVHPRTGRWFGALGFTLDVDRYIPNRSGRGRLYRFERRFKPEASDVPRT